MLLIRSRVIEEAAAAGTDLGFTFVMGLDEQGEADHLAGLATPYGDDVAVLELDADLDTRLAGGPPRTWRAQLGPASPVTSGDACY